MGDMPLMTKNGTFIINGTERVIVSQMHRSPGVFFDHDKGKTHSSGKYLFAARVIPYRGSWLDFEFDAKDHMYVRIDRRRKLPVTTLLMALDGAPTEKLRRMRVADGKTLAPAEAQGMGKEEILAYFYTPTPFSRTKNNKAWKTPFDPSRYRGHKITHDLIDARTGRVRLEAGEKLPPVKAKKLFDDGLKEIQVGPEEMIGRFLASDLVHEQTGEMYAEAGDEITEALLKTIEAANLPEVLAIGLDPATGGPYIRNTLLIDKNPVREEALIDIYRGMGPGEPPTLETAEALFNSLFFDGERYDLSAVGRVKMNSRLNQKTEDTVRTLRKEDILAILKVLVDLKDGRGEIDDIDHLGNRRVRSVGELMENQYRVGLLRMERAIRERMSSVEIDTVMPHDLINAKPAAAAVREFFGSSQLSQFMDQTNPLSEITHKRRLSALGPGGLTRERAGFEVRDVHPTHYGRICPIETPEGPNIGLINSLSCYARINEHGFIESPYRKVKDSRILDYVEVVNSGESGLRVGDHIEKEEEGRLKAGLKKAGKRTIDIIPFSFYLSAWEEDKHTIAQANIEFNAEGVITEDLVNARRQGTFVLVNRTDVDYIDVSPKQLVSVAASLVPFLEHDDANRALMGANMQRQSVPLLVAEAPLVGTGMEGVTARDSGAVILAKRNGIVDSVDSERIIVRVEGEHHPTQLSREVGSDIYQLIKFKRSNQNTCINQKPVVREGDRVVKGQVIADGPCTEQGELALGRNVLVAFMPWRGYNFEDAILISEKLVREDYYT